MPLPEIQFHFPSGNCKWNSGVGVNEAFTTKTPCSQTVRAKAAKGSMRTTIQPEIVVKPEPFRTNCLAIESDHFLEVVVIVSIARTHTTFFFCSVIPDKRVKAPNTIIAKRAAMPNCWSHLQRWSNPCPSQTIGNPPQAFGQLLMFFQGYNTESCAEPYLLNYIGILSHQFPKLRLQFLIDC